MAHHALAVANALIERSSAKQRPLTPMQVIKLVYICHGWMLGLYHRPLISQPVEAWRYGPVINSVYQELKKYGNSHVTDKIDVATEEFDNLEDDLINQVLDKYSSLSGIALSKLTHAAGTPWHIIWTERGKNSIIPDDLIEEHYAQKSS